MGDLREGPVGCLRKVATESTRPWTFAQALSRPPIRRYHVYNRSFCSPRGCGRTIGRRLKPMTNRVF